jgi:site-specific DNA recombinase
MTHNWTKKGTRQYRYYVCGRAQKQGWDTCPTKSLPAGEIEKFVVDQLRRMGTDAEFGAEVLERARVVVRGRAHQLAQERHGLEASQRRRMAEVRRLLGSARGGTVATTRLADLQEQITVGGQRLAEIHAREAALERDRVDEDDPTAALRSFDPIWDSLWPREQARVVHLVVERVAYDAAEETVAVTFRPGGVKVLAQEVG